MPPRFNKKYPRRWSLCMCFSYETIHHVVHGHLRIFPIFLFAIVIVSPTPILDWVVERVTCCIDLTLKVYYEYEVTTSYNIKSDDAIMFISSKFYLKLILKLKAMPT